jgi:hypothetical protein
MMRDGGCQMLDIGCGNDLQIFSIAIASAAERMGADTFCLLFFSLEGKEAKVQDGQMPSGCPPAHAALGVAGSVSFLDGWSLCIHAHGCRMCIFRTASTSLGKYALHFPNPALRDRSV